MPAASRQRKSRADAKLDASVVADLDFFTGPNRTKKHRAAILLAEDEMTDREIAADLNISRTTIHEWKHEPEFQQVMGDYAGQIIAEALKLPIARKHVRVKELNDLNERYHRIIEARAERHAAALADSPESAARAIFGDVTPAEAATGLLVAQPKIAANGKTVTEWAFDKSLDSAIKETHKQAATELGQWQERTAVEQTTTMVQIIPDGEG